MLKGKLAIIAWGYGFVTDENDNRLFFHKDVVNVPMTELHVGQTVSYVEGQPYAVPTGLMVARWAEKVVV